MDVRSRSITVHRMEFEVEWPPGHVACYLLDAPEPILVDAALPNHEDAFTAALNERGYEPGDIGHVLITHPHVDHIGQVGTVLNAGNPTVYAPASVRERFARDSEALGERVRRNCVEVGMPDERVEGAVDMAVESLERNAELLAVDAVDNWISPGETVAVGDLEVSAVHAPGHQADHLCYVTELHGESALLAGDMAIQPFRPVVMHDGLDDGHREAFEAFYTALDRLSELDVERVYPGHGPVHTAFHAAVERDRESLDHRLERVCTLLDAGHTTVPGLAFALAGDRSVKYLIPESMSALAHLERIGRITSSLEGGVRTYDLR